MNRNGRKTLESWIDEAMSDKDKDGPLSQLSLVHMVGMQEKEIHTTKFGGGKSWPASELAPMFNGKARTYCQDIPGVQTFQLIAFYNGRTTPEAFFPFVVNVNSEGYGLGTEAPTEQGERAQKMRRDEMLIQQVYRRQQVQDEHSIRMIELLGRQVVEVTRENRDIFVIMKDMMMAKALDQHENAMKQLNFERDTVERKKWMGWIPALANTVLGREIFPQSTADTSLVESIADSLTEDDIVKLAGVLKPEAAGPLMARLHAYEQKKNKERANLELTRQLTSPDPEADAAGDIVVSVSK